MSRELVKQTLEELAESHLPANPDLWPGIYAQLSAPEANRSLAPVEAALSSQNESFEKKPIFKKEKARLSWPRLVVAGMALVVVFGVVVLLVALLNASNSQRPAVGQQGGSPVATPSGRVDLDTIEKECARLKLGDFDCLVRMYQEGQISAPWLPLSKDLNLSQTNNGFTMSVRRVYADAGTILIGYEVKGPEGVRFDVGNLSLTDAQGNIIPGGGRANSGLGYNAAGFASYDSYYLLSTPPNLKVHLTVSNLRIRGNPLTATPDLTPTPATPLTCGSIIASTAGPNSFVNVPISFAFDFEIPFQGGKIVDINQAVKAGNRTLTLERAIVAPSGTSLLLSGFDKNRRNIEATLTVGGKTSPSPGNSGVTATKAELNWFDNLANQPGEWTLTVTEISEEGVSCNWVSGYQCTQPSPGAPRPKVITSGGPWIFHFTIPTGS